MGAKKETSNNNSTSTVTPTADPNQQKLNDATTNAQLQLLPSQTAASQSTLDLFNQGAQAFGGGKAANGPLGSLIGGITPEVQNSIVQESLRQIMPQFQQGGILNSGAAASIAARTAGDIYRQSAQFNIGNLGNVLNLLSGGNYQAQAPVNQQSSTLNSSLAGLKSVSQQNIGNTATYGQNPFVNSFQTGFGSTLGNGAGKATLGMFGF